MARSADRILTTHVGSLVRPPGLVRYIEAAKLEALAEGASIASRELWAARPNE